ncbi:staygreen family protein [Rossellomorea aquimaris]|uniref:staygreen family protein n=1 Tax=Rossellomorea aquimaris TaxID=189382 RepID=UPI001CD7D8B6|nr:staygreen family protein [Rossellomorea aquimaris]MCA1053852.1 staygreen family protein [Rossellomorea aquimaris]
MSEFNPEKLSVTYLPPASIFYPVDNRKYTLTHSDATGDLFLSIGCHYDVEKINGQMRDEVLGEWRREQGQYALFGKVYVSGGEFDERLSKVRFMIFKKELPLALSAIVNGDRGYYTYYPWLLDAPIYIYFESVFDEFNQVIYFGSPRQYLVKQKA